MNSGLKTVCLVPGVFLACRTCIKNIEIEISSVDWAQLSRLLSEDGDRIQSPKRCFNEQIGRWIMSKRSIIALMCHRHKLLDPIYNNVY
jgi:hypothetical protein